MWQPCRSRSCCAWPACWVATIRSGGDVAHAPIQPELWKTLESLGVGKLAVQARARTRTRQRHRGNDAARQLDDEDFAEVLSFTRRAFEMAVGFRGAADQRRPLVSHGKTIVGKPDREGGRAKTGKGTHIEAGAAAPRRCEGTTRQ